MRPRWSSTTASSQVDDVDILQVLYEIRVDDREALVPPALNPTIPLVISFLVYRAKESAFGPFALAQLRLTARSGVRPRCYLISARCDNPGLAEVLASSWGFRVAPGDISLRRFHDRVDCSVHEDGRLILQTSLVDPVPVTGHDVQYPPGMHLARMTRDGVLVPRIVQVDSEYVFRRADRGRPELTHFDREAWGRRAARARHPRLGELRGLRPHHRQRALHLQPRHPRLRGDGEGQRRVTAPDRSPSLS